MTLNKSWQCQGSEEPVEEKWAGLFAEKTAIKTLPYKLMCAERWVFPVSCSEETCGHSVRYGCDPLKGPVDELTLSDGRRLTHHLAQPARERDLWTWIAAAWSL